MAWLCCCFYGTQVAPDWRAPAEAEEYERLQRVAACEACMRANDGRLLVHGVMQRANARNRNGRIYPKNILVREAERFYASHVLPGRAFGELDHPDPASPLFRLLDAANVCHQVLDYWWEGNALVGVVEVLPTPKGEELRDYFLQGRQLGVSSRGWATLHDPGDGRGVLIQDNFELITFDFVSDPSTVGAYLSPLTSRYKKLKPQADVYAYFEAARGPAPS